MTKVALKRNEPSQAITKKQKREDTEEAKEEESSDDQTLPFGDLSLENCVAGLMERVDKLERLVKQQQSVKPDLKCFYCGEKHLLTDCDTYPGKGSGVDLPFAPAKASGDGTKTGLSCWKCAGTHRSDMCPKKNIIEGYPYKPQL